MNESLIDEIERARFTPVRLREGYDMGEVDDFLDDLSTRLRSGEPVTAFIADARFTPVRLREGYYMGDVDRLLQRVSDRASHGDAAAAPASDPAEGKKTSGGDPEWRNPVAEVTSPLARLFRRPR